MDENLQLIFRIVAYSIYCIVIISWLPRKKKKAAELGDCILPLKKRGKNYFWLALAVAPGLIFLQRFRDFGPFINTILSLCAILSAELVMKERNSSLLSGVYKNGIVVDGRFILFSDILALPTLAYEHEEEIQDDFYRQFLKIVTEQSGEIYVGFSSVQERENAVATILAQEPRLKP